VGAQTAVKTGPSAVVPYLDESAEVDFVADVFVSDFVCCCKELFELGRIRFCQPAFDPWNELGLVGGGCGFWGHCSLSRLSASV